MRYDRTGETLNGDGRVVTGQDLRNEVISRMRDGVLSFFSNETSSSFIPPNWDIKLGSIQFESAGDYFDGKHDPETGHVIKRKSERPKEVYISENDIVLVSGLVTAYSSRVDGEWKVKCSTNDRRKWMPEYLYEITRKNGNIEVSRAINDLRRQSDRQENVYMKNKLHILYEGDEKYDKDHLFGEEFLTGKRQNDFYVGGGLSPIPFQYDQYLKNIKSYALKIAKGDDDYGKELEEISEYSQKRFPDFIREEEPGENLHERSVIRKYKSEYLLAFVKDAEVLVTPVERQNSFKPEGGGMIG